MKTEKTEHYHIGIRDDEKRGLPPLHYFNVPKAKVTFHYWTGTYDKATRTEIPKRGQVVTLTEDQRAAIKEAFLIDRTPCEVVRRSEYVRKSPDNPVLVEKPVEVGFSAYGRGKVVQWFPVASDDGKKLVGWNSRVLDLSDKDYEPTPDADDEVELGKYMFANKNQEGAKFDPPSIDLSKFAEHADKIEADEERRDPEEFAKQKERAKRAKAAGVPLAEMTPPG